MWIVVLVPPGIACGADQAPETHIPSGTIESQSFFTAPPTETVRQFESLPRHRTGLDFVYHWNESPRYERLLNSSAVGGGVGVGDYDGDGLADLCLTRPLGGHRLYRNLGDCRFTNVTEQAGVRDDGAWSTGVTFADINADGRLDLYVCCYDGPNRLYINQGNGTFAEQAKAFGLDFNGASIMMAFGDYDRDGHLDGYLLTAGLIPKPSQRFRANFVNNRPVVPQDLQEYWQLFYLPGERAALAEAGQLDHLYHNRGDGTFEDVSPSAGIAGCDFGNAVLWWDYNTDGWPDLYVANDYFGPDHLYRNNGNGKFSDVTRLNLPRTPWTSMGADAADLNNDGLMDLIASDMSGTTRYKRMIDMIDVEKSGWFLELAEPRQYMRNAVFMNTGRERFLEMAFLTGMADTDWTWSIVAGDLDNDGRIDVFVPNGMTRDWMDIDLALRAQALPPAQFTPFWRSQAVRADQNLAFQNLGDCRFQSVGQDWGLDQKGPSFGAALADLDNDGDLDLVVNNFEAPARLHRNHASLHHQVKIRLVGRSLNRFGIGATIRLMTASGQQMRYVTLAHGFMSATEPVAHFGLGQDSRIDELVVIWPDQHQDIFRDLPADRFFIVSEGTPPSVEAKPPPITRTWLAPAHSPSGLRHEEEIYDDFAHQPLLPWKLSELGPGLAFGDVNADGCCDFYLSGSSGHPGSLYLGNRSGKFQQSPQPAFSASADEMASLFLDANGDGFQDLFVVTGGVEVQTNQEVLRDRLYLNDRNERFLPAPVDAVPDLRESGSTAVAADADRDGDLDLFVGGRVIPGHYPQAPPSRLFNNDGGKFTDITESRAPGLLKAGMVTAAVWSDTNADGWPDLLVATEWGPIRFFQNLNGFLVERTQDAGLASCLGWWNSIAPGDVDHDGDIDFAVGNLGLNSRYRPAPSEPLQLYYGDFAGDGRLQTIEVIKTSSGLMPLRGKSALEKIVPGLNEKFPTHHLYASATLSDILGTDLLESTPKLEVNTAESGVLINDGQGKFAFRSLPGLAQVAPVHGIALADLDADGHLDLILAHNSHSPHRETGRLNGGVGLLLAGRGDGHFVPLWPNRSGLLIAANARAMSTGDLNGDGWIDCVVGVNQGELRAFENTVDRTNRVLGVRLQGQRGNPTAVGSRIILKLKGGRMQTAEVYAGGGYLSQSEATVRFGLGTTGEVDQIEVRWPRGKITQHRVNLQSSPIVLKEE